MFWSGCIHEGGGLLSGRCRQYLVANKTIKHVISRCTALAARTVMKGTHATGLAVGSRELARGWQCHR